MPDLTMGARALRSICEVCGGEYRPGRVGRGDPPQRTCSRKCGALINAGPARKKLVCAIPWRECPCGKWFVAHSASKVCSDACRGIGSERRLTCARCGDEFAYRVRNGRPPRRCAVCTPLHVAREKRHWANVRKQQSRSAVVDPGVRRIDIFERDGWVCQLCFEPIDRDGDPHRDDWAPQIDHKLPQSLGGGWTWDNLQAAHRFCNMAKGNDPDFTWERVA